MSDHNSQMPCTESSCSSYSQEVRYIDIFNSRSTRGICSFAILLSFPQERSTKYQSSIYEPLTSFQFCPRSNLISCGPIENCKTHLMSLPHQLCQGLSYYCTGSDQICPGIISLSTGITFEMCYPCN